MSNNNTPAKTQQPVSVQAKKYFDRLFDRLATLFMAITVVVLPLYMNHEKYTAITAAKSGFFSVTCMLTLIAAIVLLAAMCIYKIDIDEPGTLKRLTFRERIGKDPMLMADIAIIAYWGLMLLSTISGEDIRTSLYGIDPRDNGFFCQTMYIAAYFIVSRTMKPAQYKGLIFVWGGALLSAATILHYFGVDLYNVVSYYSMNSKGELVERTLSPSYSGPFWDSTSYKFLGPVGNVNLGSYILSVALVLAAGYYITGVHPVFYGLRRKQQNNSRKKENSKNQENGKLPFEVVKCPDKHSISLLACFVIILYAELNINTDAGLVAIAAAVLAIPVVLCCTPERLCRGLVVFALAFATAGLSIFIDSSLCKEPFGTVGKALLALAVLCGAAAFAAFRIRNKDSIKRIATPRSMRIVLSSLMALAVVAGIGLSLYITKPDDTAAGALSGATVVLERVDLREKSDTIIHELGQILRGNLDDHFGHNRLFTWKRTLSLVKNNLWLGIGPDNFKTYFARFYRDEAVEMFPASNGNLDKAHNEFLDVLLCNGVLGLTAYMLFFGTLLYCCFRRADRSSFAPALGVAVVSYMAHAFFGYQLPIQSPVMWMLIGAAGAFARGEGKRPVNHTL